MGMAASEGGAVQQQTGEPTVEDILQSIRKVVGGDGPPRPEPQSREGGASESGDEVLELTEVVEHAPADEPGAASANDRPAGGDTPMLSPERRAAVRESLAALAALAAPGAAEGIVRSAESSLDGLTRELLRPMMADWLDRNLPPIVERLLQAEIARIVGRSA